MVLGACDDDDESSGPEPVSVEGQDYAFVMPDRVEGGTVRMDFSNSGEELHEFGLGKLDPDVSDVDVDKAIKSGEEPKGIEDIGGVPVLSPGIDVSITRDLEPGRYVFLCYIPDPKGRPHVDLGMKKFFEVEGDAHGEMPEVAGVVVAGDKSFKVPKIEPGRQTLELRNGASKPREFFLIGLRPGTTDRDAMKFFAPLEQGHGFQVPPEPPVELLGAMQSIAPGTSVYLTADFQSGWRYRLSDEENGIEAEFSVD